MQIQCNQPVQTHNDFILQDALEHANHKQLQRLFSSANKNTVTQTQVHKEKHAVRGQLESLCQSHSQLTPRQREQESFEQSVSSTPCCWYMQPNQ